MKCHSSERCLILSGNEGGKKIYMPQAFVQVNRKIQSGDAENSSNSHPVFLQCLLHPDTHSFVPVKYNTNFQSLLNSLPEPVTQGKVQLF